MSSLIISGPPETETLPRQSLGSIFFNQIKQWESNRKLLISSTGEEITYGNFLKTTIKTAKKLQKLGAKKGDTITIIAQNQWKTLATVVAGFYLGLAVNLLNHDYTSGELKHFISLCKPKFIFSSARCLNNVKNVMDEDGSFVIILYDDGEDSSHEINFDNFIADIEDDFIFTPTDLNPSEEIALILTSSGTTGFPKCVQLTHANFRATLLYAGDPFFLDVNNTERIVGFLPFFHLFGLAIGLASILYGSLFIILEKFLPEKFLESIEKYKITKLLAVPPILLFLVKSPLVSKYDLSSLKDILSGAAPLSKDLEETVEKKLGCKFVRQLYGMTEICGAATVIPKNIKKSGSCGKVTTGHQIKVCDVQNGQVLTVNQVGELRIKGGGIMKGYLGNDKETKESFDEEGFLKSGDLGYYDEEGYFYIVDRLKEVIKYKGFQVSPAELEGILLQHPAVKDVGVVGKPDVRSGEVPLAFIVKQPDAKVSQEELINFVASNLCPQKHLYGGVIFVEEIPKNPSGKILRKNLKEMLQKYL